MTNSTVTRSDSQYSLAKILGILALVATFLAACVPAPAPLAPEPTATPTTEAPAPTEAVPTETPEPTTEEPGALAPLPLSDELLAEFGAYIEETRELYQVPGAVVVVVQGGEVVYAEGFGVKEIGSDDPVTPDTIFSIGSLSKTLTSMMVATLVDDGLLGWDTPIVEVMPQFQLSDQDATQQITLRHAFGHTTGLPNTDLVLTLSGLPPEGFVEYLADVPLDALPGESWTYQNEMYAIGAYVGAMAAGAEYGENLLESYTDLMQERVFDPIGMTGATLSAAEAEASPNHTTPHYVTLNATLAETGFDATPTRYMNLGAGAPTGGVSASALDVGRFLMTMLADGVAPDGTQVVSAENLAETWTEQIARTPDPFLDSKGEGLGWPLVSYQGVPIVTKDGGFVGYTATMAFIPDADTGIVVLSNLDATGMFLNLSVQYRLVELLYGLDPIADDFYRSNLEGIASVSDLYSQLEPVDPEAIAPYLGDYDAPGNPHTIELRDGKLCYSRGPVDCAQLLGSPEGGYVAISPGDLLLLPFQFVEGEDGSITLVIAGELEAAKLD